MNVTIVDYNSGNISSVINSFKEVAKDKVHIEVTSDLNKIKSSDKVVLPGQGSFKSCVDALNKIKGLTDTLKGEEGISFDEMVIKYDSNNAKMDIKEIFMIGPSISILIEGYVEKKSGLVSLRGTLVPAKTLNSIISKIPLVGKILVGNKVGEGVFGISFKIKGLPNDLKTTVNPVKTLTPRFITRAIEATKKVGKKKDAKQQ